MSLGQVSLISGGQQVVLLELDELTVQALSALLYDRAKKPDVPLRVKVSTEGGDRLVHLLPDFPLIFETQQQFQALEVDKRFQLLRDKVSADGLLCFGLDGQVLEPLYKPMSGFAQI